MKLLNEAKSVKADFQKRLFGGALLIALLAIAPAVLAAQSADWPLTTFDGNICGWSSYYPVTLTYDPTQDNTGDGGGSCRVSTDYSQSGLFQVNANNVDCCGCDVEAILETSNFAALEFDVKWDNSSTVPLSVFNTNFGGASQGIVIGTGNGSICYSNVIIPDAATNGWVHVVAAINPALPNESFVGLVFQKTYPADGTGTAAFWLDNVKLAGRLLPTPVRWSGGNFTLSWGAGFGDTYSVLKSTDMVNWTTLVTGYPPGGVTNLPLSYMDTNANSSQALYRITSP